MKKYIANIITSIRIAAGIVLFFFNSVSGMFLTLYIFCGFTDLIDGPIARYTKSSSNTGALLDTVGDVITYLALVKILLAASLIPAWAIVWFCISISGVLASGFVAKVRFGKFNMVHSLFGKIMGGCVFVLPLGIYINIANICYCAICTSATISAFESNFIQFKLKEPDADVYRISQVLKQNENAE